MRLTDKELSEFADYNQPSKYDMEGTASALADECLRLRALVKDLVGCFENWVEKYPPSEWLQMGQSWQLLEETVTRAREVAK